MAQEIKLKETWVSDLGQATVESIFAEKVLVVFDDSNKPHLIDIEEFLKNFILKFDENGMTPVFKIKKPDAPDENNSLEITSVSGDVYIDESKQEVEFVSWSKNLDRVRYRNFCDVTKVWTEFNTTAFGWLNCFNLVRKKAWSEEPDDFHGEIHTHLFSKEELERKVLTKEECEEIAKTAFLGGIEKEYPKYEVKLLEYCSNDVLRLSDGIDLLMSYVHTCCQSMRNFYQYVYVDSNGDFYSSSIVIRWKNQKTHHPVAVLFCKEN